MKRLPIEIVASSLAVSTMFIPFNLPVWAAFVTWAGTFAAGGPKPDTFRRLVPTMFVGAITAWLIVTGWSIGARFFSGNGFLVFQCAVLFCLNAAQMLLARVPRLGLTFVPGMFFGFASYFGVFFGGFGVVPHHAVAALFSTMLMNAAGVVYAWLTATLGKPHEEEAHGGEVGAVRPGSVASVQ
jgi:Protein of unknown function (DUF1097)